MYQLRFLLFALQLFTGSITACFCIVVKYQVFNKRGYLIKIYESLIFFWLLKLIASKRFGGFFFFCSIRLCFENWCGSKIRLPLHRWLIRVSRRLFMRTRQGDCAGDATININLLSSNAAARSLL